VSAPKIMLFAGNANPTLAGKISDHLNIPLGKASVGRFSDGETAVEILENVRGRDVFILQPTSAPCNDNLMELLVMADALRRASAGRITAVIPYFGYARQDRRVRSARVPITAKVVADMMNVVGISRLMTVDLHAEQIQGFFAIPVDNGFSTSIMLKDIRAHNYIDYTVVAPDIGGIAMARAMAKRMNNSDLAIIDKRRPAPNQTKVMNVIGDVDGRNCMLIDDIVDTAGTLCNAAAALKERGAKRVVAYCTHPVLSGNALQNINESVIDELVVTDSIQLGEKAKQTSKIRQVSLSELLAQTIGRINAEESVSSIFSETD
jgi:ribose-phosphate pyrophosphokinase